MPKILDLTGQRFGRLVAIKIVGRYDKGGNKIWKCVCDCGNQINVRTSHLRNNKGGVKSCGCLQKDHTREKHYRLPKGESGLNRLLRRTKRHAKNRGYIFSLTKEEVRKLTLENCFYCGTVPNHISYANFRHDWGEYKYNGIDRVDNSKGYTTDNCVPCCKMCNRAKRDLSQQEFLNWVEGVHNYSILRGHRMIG